MFADASYRGVERRVAEDRRKGVRGREHPRFRAKEGAYAAIKSDYSIVGLIKDISKGGMSFQYIVDGRSIKGSLSIDIFCKGKAFNLKNIPFKITSDFQVPNKVPFSTIALRQCGGKFREMTAKQRSQLNLFIQNFTSMIRRSIKDRRQFGYSSYSGPERRTGLDRRDRNSY
jgi:hypothetical protein